jgi:hypothetical protein
LRGVSAVDLDANPRRTTHPAEGRVDSQTTADPADPHGERMTCDEADFDTGHAITERCAGNRRSIGMRPYLGICMSNLRDALQR